MCTASSMPIGRGVRRRMPMRNSDSTLLQVSSCPSSPVGGWSRCSTPGSKQVMRKPETDRQMEYRTPPARAQSARPTVAVTVPERQGPLASTRRRDPGSANKITDP
ncbi:hypothetical protein EMCG_05615 [[Emmonsia] crescens]|uniref:Uncharacterized protein n=1 Tax=[Emmonsia] crescens TaxID=73230 RepID=A0A0G2IDZ1_9EURO|nr:hypothetical protein EMCG_05615 [Emmonsia crescens UAMH 3008]